MIVEKNKKLETILDKKIKIIFNDCQTKFHFNYELKKEEFVKMVSELLNNTNDLNEKKVINKLLKKYLKLMETQELRKSEQKMDGEMIHFLNSVVKKDGNNILEKSIVLQECAYYLQTQNTELDKKALKNVSKKYSFINPAKTSYTNKVTIPTEVDNRNTEDILDTCFCTDREWFLYAKLAGVYQENYGTLNVPLDFRTFDGVENNVRGALLGYWVQFNIRNLVFSDRVEKLGELDAFCSFNGDLEVIKMFCSQIGIDFEKNINTLTHISFNELMVKIKYLYDFKIPVTKNGELHEIFKISSRNMKEKYGISLKEMMDLYLVKNTINERVLNR